VAGGGVRDLFETEKRKVEAIMKDVFG